MVPQENTGLKDRSTLGIAGDDETRVSTIMVEHMVEHVNLLENRSYVSTRHHGGREQPDEWLPSMKCQS